MAAGDSISTVETTLRTNIGFDVNNSLAEAKLCVVACREWLLLRPQTASNESSSLTLNIAQVENILNRATLFVDLNNTAAGTSRVSFASMANYRT